MRINIAATHRFHLLDLARELERQGHDVRFYSYVPKRRGLKFGLSRRSSHSMFLLALPFLVLVKLTNGGPNSIRYLNIFMDLFLSLFMKPCDVYIALGTVYKASLVSARKRFGAKVILEWGSKHNDVQQHILEQISGLKQQNSYFKERTRKGYEIADYISIPSEHVVNSFVERGVSRTKLLKNPYGVDLSMFKPTELLTKEVVFDVIMVGGWSFVKGCDLLIDFFKTSDLTFLHVGPIVNLPFPKQKNMVHVDAVDQSELITYYAKARVFVLPSRAEGLAMVQLQALVCGLPIVCSKDTGGRDVRQFLTDKNWIIEMDAFTVEDLEASILKALELAKSQVGLRIYAKDVVNQLTWRAYAKRYHEHLCDIYNCKKVGVNN